MYECMLALLSQVIILYTTRCNSKRKFYVLPNRLCVLCGSRNDQRLFSCRTLFNWFFYTRDGVCVLRRYEM